MPLVVNESSTASILGHVRKWGDANDMIINITAIMIIRFSSLKFLSFSTNCAFCRHEYVFGNRYVRAECYFLMQKACSQLLRLMWVFNLQMQVSIILPRCSLNKPDYSNTGRHGFYADARGGVYVYK